MRNFGLFLTTVFGFNENFTAVHYSVADIGVNDEFPGAMFEYDTRDCWIKINDKKAIVKTDKPQPRWVSVETDIALKKNENVRMTIEVHDFIYSMYGFYAVNINASLIYGDGSQSEINEFKCEQKCIDGAFKGNIDIKNDRNEVATIHLDAYLQQYDNLSIDLISTGDLILRSKIFDESRGVVRNSCHGKVTGSMYFGKAGVGKSTVASLSSSLPGVFESGSSSSGTTTLGTWLSSGLVVGKYANFSDEELQPVDDMPIDIPKLNSLTDYYEETSNLVWFDTEGLDYQTELGDNYDIVTVLPHLIISENVFLVVKDRINAAEVMELLEKLATAAERVNGTLLHREDKLFGNFIIIVNKSQSIKDSDEEVLLHLKIENPSLVNLVNEYFVSGPEVVQLPTLQWDYDDLPDFDAEGFFMTYEDILLAHPPLRDRMFYGLHKLADYMIQLRRLLSYCGPHEKT